MRTPSEKLEYQKRRRDRRQGSLVHRWRLAGGLNDQTPKEIMHEAEKLEIKPGMKLTWDDELGRMVWK